MKKKEAIILANGLFPTHAIPLNKLFTAEFIICCDGAADKLIQNQLKPSIIIGDLDSVSKEIKTEYANILVENSDQYSNDLTKAFNWAISAGFSKIIILGATGLCEDHTIGNFYLVSEYSKQAEVELLSDHGTLIPVNNTKIIQSLPEQQVSIFTTDRETIVSFKGLRYPLENRKLESPWMGTLNECLGHEFTIETDSPGVLVFLRHLE